MATGQSFDIVVVGAGPAGLAAAIEAANTAENYTLALRLTQLAMALQFAITELRRKDGDDAWERI